MADGVGLASDRHPTRRRVAVEEASGSDPGKGESGRRGDHHDRTAASSCDQARRSNSRRQEVGRREARRHRHRSEANDQGRRFEAGCREGSCCRSGESRGTAPNSRRSSPRNFLGKSDLHDPSPLCLGFVLVAKYGRRPPVPFGRLDQDLGLTLDAPNRYGPEADRPSLEPDHHRR